MTFAPPIAIKHRTLYGTGLLPILASKGSTIQDSSSITPKTAPVARSLDRASFARAFQDAYPVLHVIAAAEVGRSDADDVLQEAAMRAMDKLSDFTPGTNFKAWMAAFVRGVSANHRRSEQRRTRRTLRMARSQPSQHTPPSRGPSGDAPTGQQLERAMDQLTIEQRTCLLLRTVMSHSFDEIERILDIPATTARSHVFRARKRLLELLPQGGSR